MTPLEILPSPTTVGLETPRIPPPRPSLHEMLSTWPLYRYTGWLGWCDDGLPMLYEMFRTDLRPTLFLVETPARAFPFLDTLVASLTWGSEPRQLQLYFITQRPREAWWGLVHRNPTHQDQSPAGKRLLQDYGQPVSHVRLYARPGSLDADEAIRHLAGIVEQRTFGRHNREAILLVLDDLSRIWTKMGDDAKALLPYILREGGRWKVGVVAWMTYAEVVQQTVPQEIRALFRWPAFGAAYKAETLSAIRGTAPEVLRSLHADEAVIKADGSYLPFWPLHA